MSRIEVSFRLTAVFVGAAFGFLLALFAEFTGHPAWTVLLMLLCLLAPPLLVTFGWVEIPQSLRRIHRRPAWVRSALTVLLVVLSFAAMEALDVNPRDYAYIPLLAPVIMSAGLFGFGPGLFAVVLSTVWTDFYYAPPVWNFAVTEWKDLVGLAVFAIFGGLVSLSIQEFSQSLD
jgi:hypothetical protein